MTPQSLAKNSAVKNAAPEDAAAKHAASADWGEVVARVEALNSVAEGRGIDSAAICRVDAVQAAFAEHRFLFETIEAARAGFATRAEAEAVCGAAREDPLRFPATVPATPQVVEPPLPADGYLGLVTRADLPPEVAEILFADAPEEVRGPLAHAGRWWAYRILLPRYPEMNPGVYAWCEMLLLERALGAP